MAVSLEDSQLGKVHELIEVGCGRNVEDARALYVLQPGVRNFEPEDDSRHQASTSEECIKG